jgi:hypothetical protein
MNGQAEPALLVDHVQELQLSAISDGVEEKVHGPHVVGMFSPIAPNLVVGRPSSLLLASQ